MLGPIFRCILFAYFYSFVLALVFWLVGLWVLCRFFIWFLRLRTAEDAFRHISVHMQLTIQRHSWRVPVFHSGLIEVGVWFLPSVCALCLSRYPQKQRVCQIKPQECASHLQWQSIS